MDNNSAEYQECAALFTDEEKAKCLAALCDFEPDFSVPAEYIDFFWCREALEEKLLQYCTGREEAHSYSEAIRKGLLNAKSHPNSNLYQSLSRMVEPALLEVIVQVRYLTSYQRCMECLKLGQES